MSDSDANVKVKVIDLSKRPGCIHRLLIRLVINAAALYVASLVISGIHLDGLKSIIIVAAIFVALLQNAVGLMVSQRWADVRQWNIWRSYYARSPLLPTSRTLLRLWRQLLAPFFRTLPPALTPQ